MNSLDHIATLGRNFHIGDFYDCRTDRIVPGKNVIQYAESLALDNLIIYYILKKNCCSFKKLSRKLLDYCLIILYS